MKLKLIYNKLDFGCGEKKQDGFVGIDIGDFNQLYPKGEFIRDNVFRILPRIASQTIEYIRANQFIEHIPKDKFIDFINQCYRILKTQGIAEFIFPPAVCMNGTPNLEFFTDPTHCNYLVAGSFYLFSKKFRDGCLADYRGYGIKTNFEYLEVKYISPNQLKIKLIKLT